ncbi:MAG: OFA family MFS transporter [Gemmatimonadetes bacterium]|nr:OFA family MFS transporter [Gemmatimonadota bacterium]
MYAWSFFQTLLVRQLGWTFTETAWAFSLTILSLGTSAAWAGVLLPKVGPRSLAVTGSVMFSVGYMLASLALKWDMLALFYVGYGVIGGAGIGLGYVTPVATVAKWFPDKKGLATGIVVMGFGVGAFLLSKGLAPLLVSHLAGDLADVFLGLGVIFACVLIPCSLLLSNPPAATEAVAAQTPADESNSAAPYLRSSEFALMWIVFFCNIAAGISVISFQSELLQEVWGLADPTVEPATLAEYGATLIAVSSLCNGVGRLFWGLLSDRLGRVKVFRILLASQMVVFGILMTERNPYVFSVLVCYVLLCFGGGFATMPSFVLDVFGPQKMSTIYGTILTAWAAAGICGPLYVGYLKDQYPDRAFIYCFLIGILMLGLGYVFSYLLSDDRIRLRRPTLEDTLRQYGILPQGS